MSVELEATVLESPDLKEVLRRVGRRGLCQRLGAGRAGCSQPGVQAFEYRHAPDPREIDASAAARTLEELRAADTLIAKGLGGGMTREEVIE